MAFTSMWTDKKRPLDISRDSQGILYVSERAENGTPPQFRVLDGDGNVLASWPSSPPTAPGLTPTATSTSP